MMSLTKPTAWRFANTALGSAGTQCCFRFVGPQKALQSWKWECHYKVLDNSSSLHIWRLIEAETQLFLEGLGEKSVLG